MYPKNYSTGDENDCYPETRGNVNMFDFTDTFNGHDIMPPYYGDGNDSPNTYYKEPPSPVLIFGREKKQTDKAILFDLMVFDEYGHQYERLPKWLPKKSIQYCDHSGEPYFEGYHGLSVIKLSQWLFKKIQSETKSRIKREEYDY